MLLHIRGMALALALCGVPLRAQPGTSTVYQLTTVAGSDLVGDGGAAAMAQVAQPEGLAIDSGGNLYIADAANHRVRMVSPAGVITTVAGNGHPGFSGDGGPASQSQLNQPYGLSADAQGNLYIADLGNQRIRRVGPDGIITTVAGNGESGSSGDGGAATSAQMLSPRNLAVDPAGNIYVSEFAGHRVRRITTDGILATIAGTGVAGFSGDGGPATAAQLAFPAGLALDPAGALYIADTTNFRVRKVKDGLISTTADATTFGVPYIRLSGLATDAAGKLYIPDSINNFVWRIDQTGFTRVAGAPGSGVSSGDGQPATKTALNGPVDVVLDSGGNLYISEARRVRSASAATGKMATIAGDGAFGFSGDGGSAMTAALNGPAGLALWNGDLYIADQGNQRIRKATSDGLIQTVAGTGEAAFSGDGLAATSAALHGPAGLTFDQTGNLYLADVYNSRVRRIDPSGIIATVAGDGLSNGFGGEGDPATLIPLFQPRGVAADATGNLYVSDTNHNRVIRFRADGAMYSAAGDGSPGYSGDGAGATGAQLQAPSGLSLDDNGNFYIADTLNHSVRKVDGGGVISTVAGTGVAGFKGDGGHAAAAALNSPCALAVDSTGDIFIADSGNNRVRMVTPDGNIATIAGTGDAAYNGESGPALHMALDHPCGLAINGQGNLLVADTGNNRIRQLTPAQVIVTPPALVTIAVANCASFAAGPLAVGEIFSIFGQGIGPETGVAGAFDGSGMLPVSLGDTQVLFDNTPAPLFYVQSQQINAQVPYELAGRTSAQLQVLYHGAPVASMQISLSAAMPALFTASSGTGEVIAVNEDGTINSENNPAPRGSIVVLYATGEGQTSPAGMTGRVIQAPLPEPSLPVSLTIGGIPTEILYAGGAPDFVGLTQINARVPSGFVPEGKLQVVLTVGTTQSQPGVTIAVR